MIAAAVVPWLDFQNHTHWSRVQWIPFVTPPIKTVDIIVNVVLYLPYGFLFPWRSSSRRSLVAAVATATALSLFTEWTQLYSHSRFPSTTDVTCNAVGAGIGFWLAGWWGSRGTAGHRVT